MQAELVRFRTSRNGTVGRLYFDGGFKCFTMEPPWIHNLRSVSCIPKGIYRVTLIESPKYGAVYEVHNVPGRTSILIHSGNYGGHEEYGLKTDTDGCILPGDKVGFMNDQEVVTNSRDTLKALMEHTGAKRFELTVIGVETHYF